MKKLNILPKFGYYGFKKNFLGCTNRFFITKHNKYIIKDIYKQNNVIIKNYIDILFL